MSTNFFEWPAFTTLVDAAGSSIARPKQTPAHSVEATRGRQQRQDSPTAASDGGARSSTTLPSGRTSAPSSAPVSARSVSAEEDLLQFAETDAPPGVSRSATATTATVATQPRRSEAVPLGSPNLFVAELPPSVDDEALEGTFRRFGIIISAKVMLDVHTAVSRGFGFVLFENAVDAAAARDALQGQPVPGHGGKLQISVSRHRGENLTAESRVVYVRNLPVAVGRPRLETYLQRFGRVVKLQLKGSANGAAAVANAVIEFAQPESARAAVAALHGKRPFEPECEIPLLAKLEEPRKLREQRLQHVAEDADNQFGAAQHPSMSPASNAAAPTRRSKPQLAADAAAHQQQPQLAAKPAESEPRAQEAKAVQKGLRDEVPPTAQPPLPSARPAPTAAGPVYVVPARPSAASEAITSSTAQHLVPSYASPYALGSTAAGGSAPGYYYCFYPPLMGVVPALPGSHSLFGHMYPPTLGYHQPLVPPPQPPQGYYYASAPPAMITHPTMSYTFYAQ